MNTMWLPDLAQYDGPKYLALSRSLRDAVRRGDLVCGDKLPPVRDLAWRIGMTPGTVARAYQIATQEGILEAAVGRGTFVASQRPRLGPTQPVMAERPRRPQFGDADAAVIDLRSPTLPDVGQAAAIARAMRQIGAEGCADYLAYPGGRRDLPLREAVTDWLSERILGAVTAEDIVLTSGGQNGVVLALQCCLRGARPGVLCEELAYPGFRHAARLNRADVVPVPIDGEGMVPAALDAACKRSGARIVCITSGAHNPTTVQMPLERRRAIAEVAQRHDLQIIEDDCYSLEPQEGVPTLRALVPERTWFVSCVSKSLSAGLRFGALVCPTGLGEAGRLAAQHASFGLARPVADIMLSVFESGALPEITRRVRAAIDQRLEITVNALGSHEMQWQRGLAFVWLKMPQGWRASTFAREAEAAGILIRSADEFAAIESHSPNAVRLSLDGALDEARFSAALARLARLLAHPPADLSV